MVNSTTVLERSKAYATVTHSLLSLCTDEHARTHARPATDRDGLVRVVARDRIELPTRWISPSAGPLAEILGRYRREVTPSKRGAADQSLLYAHALQSG